MITLGAVLFADLRLNTSSSIPEGLYWRTSAPIVKNDYIIFCPPVKTIFTLGRDRGYFHSGFCHGDYGYLMKKVVGVAGDQISIGKRGVSVDQYLLADSKPFAQDALGRSLPQLHMQKILQAKQLLLMTDRSPTSFDARYFGVITPHDAHVIKPIITW